MKIDGFAFFSHSFSFFSHSMRHSCVRKRPPVRQQVPFLPALKHFFLSFFLPPSDAAAATDVSASHEVDRCECENLLLSRNHSHASKQKESQKENRGM